MWMSVPQIAALRTLISRSFGPTTGTGTSSIQIPGSGLLFTSAFMSADTELTADLGKGGERQVEMFAAVSRRHLGANPGLALGYDRIRETDHVDALVEQPIGHIPGQVSIAQHDRDDRVLAR